MCHDQPPPAAMPSRPSSTNTSDRIPATNAQRASALRQHIDDLFDELTHRDDPAVYRIHGEVGALQTDLLAVPERVFSIDSAPSLYDYLFGQRAPDGTHAVVVHAGGRTLRPPGATSFTPRSVLATVSLGSDGACHSVLRLLNSPAEARSGSNRGAQPEEYIVDAASVPAGGDGPHGLMLDVMARYLGMSTPDEFRSVGYLIAAMWADRLVSAAGDGVGFPDRPACAALHPLAGPGAAAEDEFDSIVRRTVGLSASTDWQRIKDRAAEGVATLATVVPEVAAWSDAGLFARLLLAQFPDLLDTLSAIDSLAPPGVAASIRSAAVRMLDVAD